MPSTKDLKKRIGTVKNTQQTTRAMKMVSAAKLRRAQDAITSQRPFARKLGTLMQRLAAMPDTSVDSPLLGREAAVDDAGKAQRRVLLVLVTSDRGLCGGFNANIIKGAAKWLKANQGEYTSISFAFLGRKGFDFYKTRKIPRGPNFSELTGKVSLAKAKRLSEALIQLYLDGEYDEIKFIFNEFKNAAMQKVLVEDFLPLNPGLLAGGEPVKGAAEPEASPIWIVKPSPKAVLESLLSRHFTIQAFRIMLESQASEHGARMSAMENATKNAGEMIRKLTLQYNKQRQAGITKELLEIISGSESQKAS